jgi:hypothetical protein
LENRALLRPTAAAVVTIILASLVLGGCLGKSIPSNHDILEAIQMAMDEDARSMFKVTRVKRLNGYSAGGEAYRVECHYDLRWIRQMPKRMEDLQNQMNNLSEQDKAAMRNSSAGGLVGILALMGGVNEMARTLQLAALGYRQVGDTVTFEGIFEMIPSEQGWILAPKSRGSLMQSPLQQYMNNK